MSLIVATWTIVGLAGVDKEGTLHLIDRDQLGTSQGALCDESPPVGTKWTELEGPSGRPTCLACLRERGPLKQKRPGKLRFIRGGRLCSPRK